MKKRLEHEPSEPRINGRIGLGMHRLLLAFLSLLLSREAPAQIPPADSFNPGAFTPGVANPAGNGPVWTLAVQADGKILVGGQFTSLGGQTRKRLGRLNPDGTLDSGFNPEANQCVYSVAVQPDGKILVGGLFTTLGGQARSWLGRLNPDGSLDTGFNPGANSFVAILMVQADGKILAAGAFTTLGGQAQSYLGRLNPDGTLDTGFASRADSWVESVALQADGKILVGGDFGTLCGQSRYYIGRLNADGSLDTGFNPGADSYVACLALQADGKILVGGLFSTLGGQSRSQIGRLNRDGTVDTGFSPGAGRADGFSPQVSSIALQADGRILVGGYFTSLGGQARTNIGRLNPDGTVDTGFNAGAGDSTSGVKTLVLQADGKILVGGCFTSLCGQARTNIGRLSTIPITNQAPTDIALSNASVAEHQPSGTSVGALSTTDPDLANTFSYALVSGTGSTDNGSFSLNGSNLLTAGTFHSEVKSNYTVRVRSTDQGGLWVEKVFTISVLPLGTRPTITQSPTNQTVIAGNTVTLTVSATGTTPLAYRWCFNGTNLINGGRISGATNSTLTISNVQTNDGGGYAVVVTNVVGAVTSTPPAVLTVLVPPTITQAPTNLSLFVGATAAFAVTASGTPPLGYQWRFNGTNLSGATNSAFSIAKVATNDAGAYQVVVANWGGSVTSAVAQLQVRELLRFQTTNGVMGIVNGNFRLRLVGMSPTSAVLLEASSNLVNWTPLYTNPPPATLIKYSDPIDPNQKARFYRGREIP